MDQIKNLAIIGVGLLGGSLGLAIKKKKPKIQVWGLGRSKEKLVYAFKRGAIDQYSLSFSEVLPKCDFVVIATPVQQVVPLFFSSLPFLKEGAIVTDVGSTKQNIIQEIQKNESASRRFVGSHPITGSEKAGVEFAQANLYEEAKVIVSPHHRNSFEVVQKVYTFWQELGSEVFFMNPKKHDQSIAWTSHLPHVLASNLSYIVSLKEKEQEETNIDRDLKSFCGPGFLDTTRIAQGDPQIWLEIFQSNQENLLESIQMFQKSLEMFQDLLRNQKTKGILDYLSHAKQFREELNKKYHDFSSQETIEQDE